MGHYALAYIKGKCCEFGLLFVINTVVKKIRMRIPKLEVLQNVYGKRTVLRSLKANFATAISKEVHVEALSGSQSQITVIGLNRPEAKNSLGRSLTDQFSSALADIAHDNNVRVVIIRSLVPGIFCAGADLKERSKLSQQEVGRYVTMLRSLFRRIEDVPIPFISAIDGPALGGGLEMALACDIRTAAEDAKMGLVETRLGIIPGAGGTQRLPRIVSPSLAKELIFTARVFNGADAAKMGIVNHVVKQNETGDAAFRKALQIAEEIIPNGPIGVRMAKQAINKGVEVDLATGYSIEEACYAQILPTQDRLEGLKAFIEKRKPSYKGE